LCPLPREKPERDRSYTRKCRSFADLFVPSTL
jgi:hypothetical protein